MKEGLYELEDRTEETPIIQRQRHVKNVKEIWKISDYLQDISTRSVAYSSVIAIEVRKQCSYCFKALGKNKCKHRWLSKKY